jgi:hypothetical protein
MSFVLGLHLLIVWFSWMCLCLSGLLLKSNQKTNKCAAKAEPRLAAPRWPRQEGCRTKSGLRENEQSNLAKTEKSQASSL